MVEHVHQLSSTVHELAHASDQAKDAECHRVIVQPARSMRWRDIRGRRGAGAVAVVLIPGRARENSLLLAQLVKDTGLFPARFKVNPARAAQGFVALHVRATGEILVAANRELSHSKMLKRLGLTRSQVEIGWISYDSGRFVGKEQPTPHSLGCLVSSTAFFHRAANKGG